MVRMTRGSYSLRGANGITHLVTRKDGPFEILDYAEQTGTAQEAQLVEAGVAEYVGKVPRKEEPSGDTADEDIPDGIPEDNPDEEESKAKKKAAAKRR